MFGKLKEWWLGGKEATKEYANNFVHHVPGGMLDATLGATINSTRDNIKNGAFPEIKAVGSEIKGALKGAIDQIGAGAVSLVNLKPFQVVARLGMSVYELGDHSWEAVKHVRNAIAHTTKAPFQFISEAWRGVTRSFLGGLGFQSTAVPFAKLGDPDSLPAANGTTFFQRRGVSVSASTAGANNNNYGAQEAAA
jgi:hypothetical protein